MRETLKIVAGLGLSLAVLAAFAGCGKEEGKVLHIGAVAVAGSSDPNQLSSMYDLDLAHLVYDTLYEYEYLARPYRVKPAMAESMPEISEDGLTYTIRLKKGIHYIDDPCFEASGGKGREAVMRDFVENLYRKADLNSRSTDWWLVSGVIQGLDELREKYKGKPFNYEEKISGLELADDYTLKIQLKKPYPQIMWVLTMTGTTLYPRECAEFYGEDFGNHPVGTGPFHLVKWQKNARYEVVRNEKYREDFYPDEGTEEDRAAGRLRDAGQRVPFADRVVVHEFSQTQPYWLEFLTDKFAWGRVPGEFTDKVFNLKAKKGNTRIWERDERGNRILTDEFRQYTYYPLPLLDFIYRGFNYEDPVVGGVKGRKLRQALSLAHDMSGANDKYYNGLNKLYAGIIPPGVAAFDPNVENPYRGPDLERAKKLLAEAGYPEGKGLPELQLCGSQSARAREQAADFIRNVKQINVTVQYEAMRFAELSQKLKQKRCQMMGLAWGGDWPDAQNFVQLMYGPNASPGSNNLNYNNPEVNRLYEQASVTLDASERDRLYQQINKIVIEDTPFLGSMARTRDYLIPAGTLNFKPEEMIHSHAKYVRLVDWEKLVEP